MGGLGDYRAEPAAAAGKLLLNTGPCRAARGGQEQILLHTDVTLCCNELPCQQHWAVPHSLRLRGETGSQEAPLGVRSAGVSLSPGERPIAERGCCEVEVALL